MRRHRSKKAMELALEGFLNAQKEMKEELSAMRKTQGQMGFTLNEEIQRHKQAELKVEKLKTRLDETKHPQTYHTTKQYDPLQQ